jgi:hypothetical protein
MEKIIKIPFILLITAYSLIEFLKNIEFNQYLNGILIWIVGYLFVNFTLNKITKISSFKISFFLILVITVLSGNTINIAIIYLLSIIAIILGRKINYLVSEINPGNLLNLMTGIAILAIVVSFLSHFPINYAGIYYFLLISIIAGAWKDFICINKFFISYFYTNNMKNSKFQIVLEGMIGGLAIFYFLISLMPEIGYDALVSHLAVPERMAHFHQWIYDPKILVWSLGPLNANWVFTIPYILTSSEVSVRITSICFLLIICFLIKDLIYSLGKSKTTYLISILLVLTTPLTLLVSSSLFTDLIWSAYFFASIVVMIKMALDKSLNTQKYIILVGIFLGMAFGVKATTLFLLVLVSLFYIYIIKENGFFYKEITKSVLLFILVGCVSYIYSYWITGNPFFPFYNEFFKSSIYPIEKFNHPFKPGLSWDLFNQITFKSGNFLEGNYGSPGFQYSVLLFPAITLIILLKKRWEIILLVISISFIILVFNATGYLRYIYPALVLLSILIALAVSYSDNFGKKIRVIFLLLFVITIYTNLIFFKAATWYANISLPVIFNNIERDKYIESRVPMRRAVEIVNEINLNNSPVAILSKAPYFSGLKSTPLIGWWYNYGFSKSIFEKNDSNELGNYLSSLGVMYLIVEDGWAASDKIDSINLISDPVKRIGPIMIRVLNSSFKFKNKIIDTNGFINGWNLSPGSRVSLDGSVEVTVESPATKLVQVNGGQEYLYEATSNCTDHITEGRLQINWMNSSGNFISASIKTFNCTSEDKTYTEIFYAPPKAVTAIVYASSHSKNSIRFKDIKLYQ